MHQSKGSPSIRQQGKESDQLPLSSSSTHGLSHHHNNISQLRAHINHDQLCDAVHEELLNSDTATAEISSLSLQEAKAAPEQRSLEEVVFPQNER
ncbi:hypothetical protein HPP92_000955 [Vanilla planifolia]|uniref:Uncharacterized protein n=1 Tax=Vanilla planifolia TaxID=51239 RepID=A0A835RQV5_VANPL|nr:hypothetical protein HPP92_000955 [Vanilla planifolia]